MKAKNTKKKVLIALVAVVLVSQLLIILIK